MDKLNTKYWFSTMKEKDSNSYEAAIENIIDNALIPMKAVLGTSKINVQRLCKSPAGRCYQTG